MTKANTMTSTTIKKISALPSPQEHWLKGSLGNFQPEQLHTYLYAKASELGAIFKVRMLTKPLVVISQPATVQAILKQRPSRYRRVNQMESVFKEMGLHGVFSAEGKQWQEYRQLMNPVFKPSHIKRMLPTIHKITQRFRDAVAQQPEQVDIQALLKKLLVDITSELAFGYDLNTLANDNAGLQGHLSFIFSNIGRRTKSPIPYWRYIKSAKDKQLEKSLAITRNEIQSFINTRKQELKSTEETNNILDALLLAKDENGQPYSDDVIYGNVLTLLLAGEDTTANTLAWTLYFLSQDLPLQEKVQQEITANYPADGKLTWESLDNFPLTFAACQESMRMQPTAPFLFLEPLNDETILGHHIPAGTTVVLLLNSGAHNTELFPNPEQFIPERWLNFSAEQKKQSAAELAPFGGGARLCPGMQLSLIEQKITLIELLRDFKIELNNGGKPVNSCYRFAVMPDNLIVNAVKQKTTYGKSQPATKVEAAPA